MIRAHAVLAKNISSATGNNCRENLTDATSLRKLVAFSITAMNVFTSPVRCLVALKSFVLAIFAMQWIYTPAGGGWKNAMA